MKTEVVVEESEQGRSGSAERYKGGDWTWGEQGQGTEGLQRKEKLWVGALQ